MTYIISNWDESFENSRSRNIKDTKWLPIPNSHDGYGFSSLMKRKDGVELYGAWILILQVASKCEPRGVLRRSDGIDHDHMSLEIITRANGEIFKKAFEHFVRIGWIDEIAEKKTILHEGVTSLPQGVTSLPQGGTEGKKEGRNILSVFPFEKFWDAYGKKEDRMKSEKKYSKIKESERILIRDSIQTYIANTPDVQFRKNPMTYLNGSCWLDEKSVRTAVRPMTDAERFQASRTC